MLWGLATGLWYFALPMAIILEARFFINRRWALGRLDFYRIADLTTLAMAALVILLFLNRAHYYFITTLVAWLPLLFFPLVTVLAYSTTERMPLDVMFYSLRRQKQPVSQSWDMNYVYFGLCLVSAGVNTTQPYLYMLAISILMLTAMFRIRSARYQRNVTILFVCVVFISAWFLQQSLWAGHLVLKEKTREWLANYIQSRIDPLRTTSSIGSIGRLKLSDAIAFRIAPDAARDFPALLQEASYDVYSGNNWMVLNPNFAEVPHAEDFKWRLAPPGTGTHKARIYLEFDMDRDIVPIPADTTEISDLPALNIRQSHYGSIEAVGLVPSPGYDISFRQGADINSPPDSTDTYIPSRYVALMERVAATSRLPDSRPIAKVRDIFRDYRYSLYQDVPASTDPLTWFLTENRAGYCEYFATATVLLLRSMGVPARYVVGWSVEEFDPGLGMYLVRKRHAHAWAIAWIGNHWETVDTTPSVWKTAEAEHTSPIRPLLDLWENNIFAFQLWWNKQKLVDYQTELYIAGAILVILLGWRIATSEQVIMDPDTTDKQFDRGAPGAESPFYRIIACLEQAGYGRHPGEVLSRWLSRIGERDLETLLAMHNRLRFGPGGLTADEASQLNSGVAAWLDARSDTSK